MVKKILTLMVLILLVPLAHAWSWNWGNGLKSTSSTSPSTPLKTQQNYAKSYTASYPVVFVHGWRGNSQTFKDTQIKLDSEKVVENKGEFYSTSSCKSWSKSISVNFEYYDTGQDKGISYYADLLSKAVDTIKSCTGSSKVTIVAHSMGGLVAREYMRKKGDGSVNKLIMTETPNYGSPLAKYESSNDAMLMIPGSTFLITLNSNKNECKYRNKMMNIMSKTPLEGSEEVELFAAKDVCSKVSVIQKQTVAVPAESAKLKGAKNVQIDGCTHADDWRAKISDLSTKPINTPSCEKAYNHIKKQIS